MKTKAPTTRPTPTTGRPVLVTTSHRGVFFGYLIGEASKEKVLLANAQSIIYWDAATRGFLGLAATGPTKGCRIGPPAGAESVVFDITGVFGCTEQAVRELEAAPWAK